MMLSLAVGTGLRISELINLTTSSIHTGTSPYVECEGKGRKHRATPLSATTRDQLRTYLQERNTQPGTALFPGPTAPRFPGTRSNTDSPPTSEPLPGPARR